MVFTQEDRLKLGSNAAEMVDYIKENIQPRVNDEIEIHFGKTHASIRTGSITNEYHLKVTPDSIEYAEKFGSYYTFGPDVAIGYPQAVLDFVKNWFDIKCRLNTAVSEQEDDRKAIYDFKV